MKKTPVDFRPLLLLVNLTFGLCIVFFIYLLAGDALSSLFNGATEITQKERATRSNNEPDVDEFVNGIHVQTGLIYDEGFAEVRSACTVCHSAKLVTQNRATREGWRQMIRWMQETQGLWDLGANERIIVNYLAKNYAPEEVGRRANLDVSAIEWYILEIEE